MPRSNRPRRGHDNSEHPDLDLERARSGWNRTEVKGGFVWNVRPIAESRALKTYTCPGCGTSIGEGVAHLVVWRSEGVLGDAHDIAGRRHWHTACWKVSR